MSGTALYAVARIMEQLLAQAATLTFPSPEALDVFQEFQTARAENTNLLKWAERRRGVWKLLEQKFKWSSMRVYPQSRGTLRKCWMIHLPFSMTSRKENLRSSALRGRGFMELKLEDLGSKVER